MLYSILIFSGIINAASNKEITLSLSESFGDQQGIGSIFPAHICVEDQQKALLAHLGVRVLCMPHFSPLSLIIEQEPLKDSSDSKKSSTASEEENSDSEGSDCHKGLKKLADVQKNNWVEKMEESRMVGNKVEQAFGLSPVCPSIGGNIKDRSNRNKK